MAKKMVTLYIDASSIRLLVVRGRKVKRSAVLSLEPGLVKNNIVVNEREVAARIREFLKRNRVRNRKIILGISGLHCLSRPTTLPVLPRAMLAEAMEREARRILPISPEESYISWQITSVSKENIHAFIVAIPCKVADTILRTLQRAGLKPYFMDVKPLALVRVVSEPTAIIVDVQPTEFDIIVMVEGIPQPVRTLLFLGESLSREDKLTMIRDELRRTLAFYNSNNPEKPLVPGIPIFVSGESAEEPGPAGFLANEFEHQVLPLPSPVNYLSQVEFPRYAVNVGLTLGNTGNKSGHPRVNLNVLPVRYQPVPVSIIRIAVLPAATVVIAMLVLLVMRMQYSSASISLVRDEANTSSQLLSKRVSQRSELNERVDRLEKDLVDAEASRDTFNAAFDNLDRSGSRINADLAVITNNLSDAITMTRINYAGDKITIDGSGATGMEVLSYARDLYASGRFTNVVITGVRIGEDGRGNFTLILYREG